MKKKKKTGDFAIWDQYIAEGYESAEIAYVTEESAMCAVEAMKDDYECRILYMNRFGAYWIFKKAKKEPWVLFSKEYRKK
jgi:hypothetical protein